MPLPSFGELEIGIHRYEVSAYTVELRYVGPDDDSETRLTSNLTEFDPEALNAEGCESQSYAERLTRSFFADPNIQAGFGAARAKAHDHEPPLPLRIRLFIGPSAPDLHDVCWEKLLDPQEGSELAMDERIYFSRYLSSTIYWPVRTRQKEEDLKALIVVANPSNLHTWQPQERIFAALNVDAELARATNVLGEGYSLSALKSAGSATLDNIIDRLHENEDLDILYLICHGILDKKESKLALEKSDGQIDVVTGTDIIKRMKRLVQLPRLVVLASCQSAGNGGIMNNDDGGMLAALGPRLAQEAGIPAVLAMQGNISIATVEQFMPIFFREIRKDGLIDRAMTVARGAVNLKENNPPHIVSRPDDRRMPVLYTRLRSGRIWYIPGFAPADDKTEPELWDLLVQRLKNGSCTPILGFGLLEPLIGTTRNLARRLAEKTSLPMAEHEWDNLPQVAEYMEARIDDAYPREELRKYFHEEILRRHMQLITDAKELTEKQREEFLAPDPVIVSEADKLRILNDLIKFVGQKLCLESHKVLSKIPCRIYISATPDDLLDVDLIARGRQPQPITCPWNVKVIQRETYKATAEVSVQSPLIYHAFGRLTQPRSLVLTQDEFFLYLIGVTNNRNLIPPEFRATTVDSSLIFLGFHVNEWSFRVLLRSIMSQPGAEYSTTYRHVALQIDPESSEFTDPVRARRFLERYLRRFSVDIYWGSITDFFRQLQIEWKKRTGTDLLP